MIIRTASGADVQLREANLGALITAAGGQIRSSGGIQVTGKNVMGIAAATDCIRKASQAVAKRRLAVWRGQDIDRSEIKTTWQSRFFANPPNELDSWFLLLEQTEASLTARNNAYWIKTKDRGQVAMVEFLHPDAVTPRWNPARRRAEYRIATTEAPGYSEWLDSSTIVHFRVGYVDPGAVAAPSPIQVFAEMFGSTLAKQRYESRMYDKGLLSSTAIIYGEKVSFDQAQKWRRLITAEESGIDNSGKLRVFGGAPTISNIGLSMNDAQFIESMGFGIEEISRALGVPASLIGGVATRRGDAPISPEHEETRWRLYGLEPRLMRIEETIQRDPDFFGVGARDYINFAPVEVRGDIATESAALVQEVQSGILTADEARARKGYAPHPDGQGAVVQVVPVGGSPAGVVPQQLAALNGSQNGDHGA